LFGSNACLTFEELRVFFFLQVGVRWCLHGVHCEQTKSSLHPSSLKAQGLRIASTFEWSIYGVNSIRQLL
jgi:hypothetical protein